MGRDIVLAAALMCIVTANSYAAPCATDDLETTVTGVSQCLLMRRYGPTEPTSMVVWLHGDVSSGGPANYHFAHAQKTAEHFASRKIMSVALVRPGYPDGTGASSSVSFLHGGRADHYTRENISEVAAAIERLRLRFKPKSVIVVGHSGGAATAAVLLGMKPEVADGAVLVSCPCDLDTWRNGRRPWGRSENPTRWAEKIPTSKRVVALTGGRDDNTAPQLASAYAELLKSRGIDATFQLIPEATHTSALRSAEVLEAVGKLLAASE